MFEYVRHERLLLLLLSLTDPDILKQSNFTKLEVSILNKSSSGKVISTENIKSICCCILNRMVISVCQRLAYPNLKIDTELLKIQSKDDEMK